MPSQPRPRGRRQRTSVAKAAVRLALLALLVLPAAVAGTGGSNADGGGTSTAEPTPGEVAPLMDATAEPADTATETTSLECGAARTLSASGDAWVDQGSPSNSFGADAILKVQSKQPAINFRALVRFTLPPVPEGCALEAATLRLYAASAASGRTLQAAQVAGEWVEHGVTWNNQPGTTGAAATSASGTGNREWNVTAQVQEMFAGTDHGFLIRDEDENGGGAEQQFHSREKGETPPQLVLRFAPAGPAPAPKPAPQNTSLPTVGGTAEVGRVLSAAPGSWTNSPTSYAYQWRRCDAGGVGCVAIAGATATSYTLVATDEGATVRVAVAASNDGGSMTAESMPTAPVAPVPPPPAPLPAPPQNSSLPTVGGTAEVGRVLSAAPGSWSNSPTSYAYQWRRCDAGGVGCVAITGATATSYTLVATDEGATVRVAVTASNDGGSMTAESVPTAPVAPVPAAPSLPPLPADNLISNASFEGSLAGWSSHQGALSLVSGGAYGLQAARATANPGMSSFTLDDWPDAVSSASAGSVFEGSAYVRGVAGRQICLVLREWSVGALAGSKKACVAASSSWQRVGPLAHTSTSAGSTIDVYLVQAGAVDGDSFEADGVLLRRTAAGGAPPPAPENMSPPTVAGTVEVGQVLTAGPGSWTNVPTSYAYEWRRCDAHGAGCAAVNGATATTYVVDSADQGATLRVAVTASNGGGSARAESAHTVPVPPTPTTPLVTPPAAPRAYVVPSGAMVVRTAAELASAVAASTPRDIVLEDGVYERSSVLSFGVGHRLWARTPGGAVLRFGLVLGGNAGGGGQELHGLRLDVSNPAVTQNGAVVNTWGAAGQNVGVYDSWLLGNRALSAGVRAHQVNGLKVQRVVVRGFTDWGIFFQTYYPLYYTDVPSVRPVVSDADISSVHRPIRGASDGTAEAGLWAGVGCLCSRIKIRDTGWSGVLTAGNENGGLFEDLDIGDVHGTVPAGGVGHAGAPTGVGIYVEHYTRRTVFRRVHVHAGNGIKPRVGIHTEWADPGYGGTNPESASVGAAYDVTLEDSTLDTTSDGVYLADATRTTVRRVTFIGQKFAAIRDFMTSRSGHSTTHGENTYAMLAGALAYTQAHSSSVAGYNDQ